MVLIGGLRKDIYLISIISDHTLSSAPQSKNAVSTNIKHRRYIYLMSNFSSILLHLKGCMCICLI